MTTTVSRMDRVPFRFDYFLKLAVFSLAYVITGMIGLFIQSGHEGITPIWPPSGIALFAFLRYGPRMWPVIPASIAILAWNTGIPPLSATLAAIGNLGEAWLGWYLLQRYAIRLERGLQDTLRFMVLPTLLAPLVAATIGPFGMVLGGVADWPDLPMMGLTWWLGDACGILLFTPLLVAWWHRPSRDMSSRRLAEWLIVTGVSMYLGWHTFHFGTLQSHNDTVNLQFMVTPFLIWAAIRLDLRGATLVSLIVCAWVLWGAATGTGPFAMENNIAMGLGESAFILIITGTALIVSALFREHAHDMRLVRDTHDRLEQRVAARTAELELSNRKLQQEISSRRSAQLALQKSEKRFRSLVENSSDAFFLYDTDGCIIDVNRQACDDLGYNREELLRLGIADIETAAETTTEFRKILQGLQSRKLLRREAEKRRRDGSTYQAETSFSLISETGQTYVLALDRDVSERRRYEQQLYQSMEDAEQANASKTRFLAAASHDLRQPLQAATSYTEVLSMSNHDPALDEPLQQLEKANHAMAGMLEKLLDISKLETGTQATEITTFCVGPLLAELLQHYRHAAAETGVVLKMVPCSVVIRSDITLLRVILQNLLANAINHTHGGRVILGCRRRGDRLRIIVMDNGIGIPVDKQKMIFEEFYQLGNPARDRNKGMGMGLAIVKRIATLLGHPLSLESVPGRGSTFSLELPVADRRQQMPPSPQTSVITHGSDTSLSRVLLIDDDEIVLHAHTMLLNTLRYQVSTASSAAEALEVITAEPASPPAIIISDYRLPDGRVGTELIEQLRALTGCAIPAIILTGDITFDIRDTVLPNCRVLQKPVHANQLQQTINQLLGKANISTNAGDKA